MLQRPQFERAHQARVAQQDLDPQGYAPLRLPFAFSDAVVPTGAVNGINTTFTLPDIPNPVESLMFFADGSILIPGTQFTIVDNVVTLAVAPTVSVITWYRV